MWGDGFDRSPLIEYGAPLRFIEVAVAHKSDDCLTWPFAKITAGYGTVGVEGVTRLAHRVVCERVHGPPPTPRHEAAHNCGNGHLACINPRHLRWATHKENCADTLIHGTHIRGENNYATHLTEADVREIRRLYSLGNITYRELGERFGVGLEAIGAIVRVDTWKHVA